MLVNGGADCDIHDDGQDGDDFSMFLIQCIHAPCTPNPSQSIV